MLIRIGLMSCNTGVLGGKSPLIVAGSNLPKGTIYGPVPAPDLRDVTFLKDGSSSEEIIKVHHTAGRLEATVGSWIRYLPVARDVHEQNLELYRGPNNDVFLRTRRQVTAGEPLVMWFEERYGRYSGVPYLTPDHILGAGDYRCTECGQRFSDPNPLKRHLMTECGTISVTGSAKQPHTGKHFSVDQLLYLRRKCRLAISSNLHDFSYPVSFSKIRAGCLSNMSDESYDKSDKTEFGDQTHSSISLQRLDNTQTMDTVVKRGGEDMSCKDAMDEETLTAVHKSFIEYSGQKGHLCVYCGKFYSRKYGLKIHLRTHTGYKPLKCSVCLRAFGDPSNLNKHIRLHAQGHTPYKCKHCGKVLVRRRDLIRHLASRHPDVTKITDEFAINDGMIDV